VGKTNLTEASCEPLSICLLGELQVRRDGLCLSLPASRRTRALLGYLVLAGGPVDRMALCDLLWDGPDDPRAALRWSLSKLRAVVDDGSHARIVADRAQVAFDAAGAVIDTARVEVLLGAGTEGLRLTRQNGHLSFRKKGVPKWASIEHRTRRSSGLT
jgi:DNA-binding SARP family transcriptional activator